MRKDYLSVAKELISEKFPNAKCAFVAGSITRGEGSATSDIDFVIIHNADVLPRAYRDSMIYQDWPVEMFVQNINSLAYFMEKDVAIGVPILVNMVAEGIILPENNPYAIALKDSAQKIMEQGPDALTQADFEKYRYMITDNLDDILDYKNMAELYGSLGWLYQELGNFYLRANRKWSGRAKSMSRAIKKAFPELLPEYQAAFKQGFAGNVKPVLELADRLLAPFGGRYWAGWLQYAPDVANLDKKD
ncbi:MAG: nucleotidyltransferase domain-containing protein [Rickettsiales bacterium]|jgi:ribosomal protein S17E|nr:nucleotidyltransferase domain-containing protein [Rickettsiales bacterium]